MFVIDDNVRLSLSLGICLLLAFTDRFQISKYRNGSHPVNNYMEFEAVRSPGLVTTKLIFTILEFSRIAIFISAVSKSNGNGLFHTEIRSERKKRTH